MPANKLPSITTLAPAANALTKSPEYVTPPSAIAATPSCWARCEANQIADNCGIPAPAITRVVQIEPAPTPIFTASTPAPCNVSTPLSSTTLPATTARSGQLAFTRSIAFTTPIELPCAVSMTTASTCSWASASTRCSRSSPTPTAAATRRRPAESRVALGNSWPFMMSFTVMSPRRRPSASTNGNFSIRWRCNNNLASSSVVPSRAVTKPSLVMNSLTGRL